MAVNQSQSSGQTYNYPLATTLLTPALVGTHISINTGMRLDGWVLIFNESPYRIQVFSPSLTSQPIQPQTVGKVRLIPGDQVFQIFPSILIPGSSPSSKVDIQVYPGADNEPAGEYPMALPRQTAPVAASSQSGYTAFFTYSASNGVNPPAFNIFNPSNSGVVGTFYYCRVSTSGGSGAAATLYYFIGGDINIAVAVNIQPADPVNQGASQFHATGTVNQNIIQAIVPWESILALAAFQQYDLIPFPDQKTVRPGENILVVVSGPTGQAGSVAMKWNEG